LNVTQTGHAQLTSGSISLPPRTFFSNLSGNAFKQHISFLFENEK
jgi:hypothetical protein